MPTRSPGMRSLQRWSLSISCGEVCLTLMQYLTGPSPTSSIFTEFFEKSTDFDFLMPLPVMVYSPEDPLCEPPLHVQMTSSSPGSYQPQENASGGVGLP